MTNGCSMGAYHALNFFLKHPDVFQGMIALSGLYRLDWPWWFKQMNHFLGFLLSSDTQH